LPDWSVAYATGLAQLGIWSTLLSLIPFVSVWVSLKQGALTEIPQSTLRTHWASFLKISFDFSLEIVYRKKYTYFCLFSFFLYA
jgi:hypothetical protein